MKRVFLFPPVTYRQVHANPYISNFQKVLNHYFKLIYPKKNKCLFSGVLFFIASFKADFFIVNWIESIMLSRHSTIQFIFTLSGFFILKLRNKKIIWIFHNIYPHQGENRYSKWIQNYLFKYSNLIISHSKEGANFLMERSSVNILYKCHPIKKINITETIQTSFCDILIWGSILPYKGILEFISKQSIQNSHFKIHIIGNCKDKNLENMIKSKCTSNIKFENRHIEFNELANKIKNCRYVLFPYIGDCVSSSGALIDTIVLGGTPIGPHKGAFIDLAEENLCYTYNNELELLSIIENNFQIDNLKRQKFIENNSWDAFGNFLYNQLQK